MTRRLINNNAHMISTADLHGLDGPPAQSQNKHREIQRKNKEILRLLPDNIWKGRRCFCVGGGPSLKDFDWSRLKGELTIGINRTFQYFVPTIIFSMDARFWTWIEQSKFGEVVRSRFLNYPGIKLWLNAANAPFPPDIYTLQCPGASVFTASTKDGLGGGCNSGFGALNLAVNLGASPIYLLGYDMKGGQDGLQDWFHAAHPVVQASSVYSTKFLPHFVRFADEINNRSEVINLNPDSALKSFKFGSLSTIKQKDRPVVVSYYTHDTPYFEEVDGFISSVRRFGLECDVQGIDSLGSWDANTYYKASFIRRMMAKYPGRSLLWMDIDARMWSYPDFLDDADFDLGIHIVNWADYGRRPGRGPELLSGTIYIKDNETTRAFVDEWINCNTDTEDKSRFEQHNLQSVLDNGWRGKLRFRELPATYCQIFDSMAGAGEPVIEHLQLSRKCRKTLNAVRQINKPSISAVMLAEGATE